MIFVEINEQETPTMQDVTNDAGLNQTVFCIHCGFENPHEYRFCAGCTRQKPVRFPLSPLVVKSTKRRTVYMVLGLLLGVFGIHNFYANRNAEGVIQLIIFLLFYWTVIAIVALFVWSVIEVCTVKVD